MKSGFVYLRATNLVSYRVVGPYEQSASEAWKRMFDFLDKNGLRGKVNRGFGLAHDDPRTVAPDKCRYDACIGQPEELPLTAWQHLMPQRLPGGAYARHRHVGPHETIGATISKLREDWCDRHGLELANKRPLVEIYLDDPKYCAPQKLRVDICLPITFAEDRCVA